MLSSGKMKVSTCSSRCDFKCVSLIFTGSLKNPNKMKPFVV